MATEIGVLEVKFKINVYPTMTANKSLVFAPFSAKPRIDRNSAHIWQSMART